MKDRPNDACCRWAQNSEARSARVSFERPLQKLALDGMTNIVSTQPFRLREDAGPYVKKQTIVP